MDKGLIRISAWVCVSPESTLHSKTCLEAVYLDTESRAELEQEKKINR